MSVTHPARSRRGTVLAAAFVLMLGGLCYQAYAISRMGPAEPPIVATVDLVRVFNQLNVKKQLEAGLLTTAEQFDAKTKEMQAEIERLQADLDMFAPGSENRQKTEQELAKLASDIRAHINFGQWRIATDRVEGFKQIYNNIKASAQDLAKSREYDIIIVDDSLGELVDGNETDINRQISGRRFLYAASHLDITDELIAHMNQQ